MTKNIKTNYNVSDACCYLSSFTKTYVCNGGFEDESGKTRVSLSVYQKKKKTPVSLEDDVDFAKDALAELGFKDIFGDGMDGVMAIADIILEYDISKKPYTITKANLQEMKSLQEVMDNVRTKVSIMRFEPKFAEVPATEFKRAVANYIKQNQK